MTCLYQVPSHPCSVSHGGTTYSVSGSTISGRQFLSWFLNFVQWLERSNGIIPFVILGMQQVLTARIKISFEQKYDGLAVFTFLRQRFNVYLRSNSLRLWAQQRVLRVPVPFDPTHAYPIIRENYDLGSVSLAIVPLLCTMTDSFIYMEPLIKKKERNMYIYSSLAVRQIICASCYSSFFRHH